MGSTVGGERDDLVPTKQGARRPEPNAQTRAHITGGTDGTAVVWWQSGPHPKAWAIWARRIQPTI